MARRGRPRKPDALKKLEGNPGKRPLNESAPKFAEDGITCPDWLDADAKAEWRWVYQELSAVPGLFTRVDRAVLAGYCANWSLAKAAQAKIDQLGVTVIVGGMIKKNPACAVYAQAWAGMLRFAVELGITPVSRSRVTVNAGADDPASALEKWRLHAETA